MNTFERSTNMKTRTIRSWTRLATFAAFLGLVVPSTVGCGALGSWTYMRDDAQPVVTSAMVAPEFSLAASDGKAVSLSELHASRPAILIFYRGAWCPWCRGQLRRFQEHMPEIQAAGARVVAISVDPAEKSRDLTQALSLTFPLLSDPDGKVASRYGVYDAKSEYNLPAVVIVDEHGSIRYRYVGDGFRDRVEPGAVVSFLGSGMGRTTVASGRKPAP
jgi:peroxiredoxin